MSTLWRSTCGLAVVACLLQHAPAALADSIYLKNGRVIRTGLARVDTERVVFFQYGSEHAIPLALVERVVDDDRTEPAAIATSARGPMGVMPNTRPPAAPERRDTRGVTPPRAALPVDLDRMLTPESLGALPGLLGSEGGLAGLLGSEAGGLAGLLGSEAGGLAGLLGGAGSELDGLGRLLPLLPRLISAFQQPIQSPDGSRAMLDELLAALAEAGVSRAEIMARAREYGIPAEMLERF